MFANNKTWTPPVGALFVRILAAPWEHVVEFGYVHEQKPSTTSFHYYTLARIRDWEAASYFGGMLDCGVGETGTTRTGGAIVRRIANRDDVEALRKLWGDRRMTFAEWVEDVCSRPDLEASCKAMLRDAVPASAPAADGMAGRLKAAEAHAAMLDGKATEKRAGGHETQAARFTGRAEGIREALAMFRKETT